MATNEIQNGCESSIEAVLPSNHKRRCVTDKLPEKRYKILSLAHSSLTGSDLIRSLCRQLGVQPQMRRSDNVANIHAALGQLGSRWPLLVLEEAQNFSASALE